MPVRRTQVAPQQFEALRRIASWYWDACPADDDCDPFVVPGSLFIEGELISATLSFEPAPARRDPEGSPDDDQVVEPEDDDGTTACNRFRLAAPLACDIGKDSVLFRDRIQQAGVALAHARAEFDAETRVVTVRAEGAWDPDVAPTRRLVHDVFADFRRLIQHGNLATAVADAGGRWLPKSSKLATGNSRR